MKIKDCFTCTHCLGAFSRLFVASKARALGAAENMLDPVSKIPGGGFGTK